MNLFSKIFLGIGGTAVLTGMSLKVFPQENDGLSVAKKVADKVIADTHFAFTLVPQKEVLGLQVVDFRSLRPVSGQQVYAKSKLTAINDTVLSFGLSYAGQISIWINSKPVYDGENSVVKIPKEISYNRFTFNQRFSAGLKKGDNEIVIRYTAVEPRLPVVFLMPATKEGDLDAAARFSSGIKEESQNTSWMLLGPFNKMRQLNMQARLPDYLMEGTGVLNWVKSPQRFIPELETPATAAYQRDPYTDWHYSHGAMVWSIMALDTDGKYSAFAKQYIDFTLQQIPYFVYQYNSLFAWRGSYHRIFRRTMLDDTGAPILPFAEWLLREKNAAVKELVMPIANYVANEQHRLKDGTFCRPEPVEFTVWADDLFMGVPFLLQMAEITGDRKYYDDASIQVVNFRKYLLNSATGLYKHAWFNDKRQQSAAYWGRANGWVAWANAELLAKLPRKHPAYKQVLRNFRQEMKALIAYQDKNGFWHQVLDRPDSYEETSCTALFTIALARGVREGWLSAAYKKNAHAGWEAVKTKIDENGVVYGICQGTDIGYNQEFYMKRKTINNDPRGMGAVITAGIEISKLRK
ncbi:Rhamnogalacturonyl hydrolase YesR [Pedobacter sp. ok626]|uniref:glycoside hydrolase family 88/105 protein n=1 Tax=Pedobacter sp. ok626 TaxID=1761882 RepID=UPI000890DCB1|nr:glycoside hydrolase family 88 protein [Pedobacter sp. ok626]SDJ83756.1 Rhamnogalacturonyl hydrolase YesR [Pedobacter sp. ok626]